MSYHCITLQKYSFYHYFYHLSCFFLEVFKNMFKFEDVNILKQKMDDIKLSSDLEKDIVFSKAIKAGKRIYYVDVKKNRKGELFLAVTESKKVISGEQDHPSINYEKHKIFLYQEDFEHFLSGFNEAIEYIRSNQKAIERNNKENIEEIKFDIDF